MLMIGLLGGMSWQSTAEYYRLLNQIVGERLGGLHSAPVRAVLGGLRADRGDADPATVG